MSLLEEESWQREAFSSLLSQHDRRTALLAEDIGSIIDQLNELTSWELQRRDQKIDITTVRVFTLASVAFTMSASILTLT